MKKKPTKRKRAIKKPADLVEHLDHGRVRLIVTQTESWFPADTKLTVMEVSNYGVRDSATLREVWETYKLRRTLEQKQFLIDEYRKEAMEQAAEGFKGTFETVAEGFNERLQELERQMDCIPGDIFVDDDPEKRSWWNRWTRKLQRRTQ